MTMSDVRRSKGGAAAVDKQSSPEALGGPHHVRLPHQPRPGSVPGRPARRRCRRDSKVRYSILRMQSSKKCFEKNGGKYRAPCIVLVVTGVLVLALQQVRFSCSILVDSKNDPTIAILCRFAFPFLTFT